MVKVKFKNRRELVSYLYNDIGMTKIEIARRLGVSRSRIYRLLNYNYSLIDWHEIRWWKAYWAAIQGLDMPEIMARSGIKDKKTNTLDKQFPWLDLKSKRPKRGRPKKNKNLKRYKKRYRIIKLNDCPYFNMSYEEALQFFSMPPVEQKINKSHYWYIAREYPNLVNMWFKRSRYPRNQYWALALFCRESARVWFKGRFYPQSQYWALHTARGILKIIFVSPLSGITQKEGDRE